MGQAPRATMFAIFAVSATTLAAQLAQSRLLSTTIDYHFSFLVIALVMLGLSASALSVLRYRDAHGREATLDRAGVVAAFGGALLASVAPLYVISGGFVPRSLHMLPVLGLMVGLFGVFWATGWVIAALLDGWSSDVARVYRSDLLGAAAGCVVGLGGLSRASPMSVMIAGAVLLGVSAIALSPSGRRPGAAVAAIALALFALDHLHPEWMRLRYAKNEDPHQVEWERWNHLARVTVSNGLIDPDAMMEIFSDLGVKATRDEVEAIVEKWNLGWGMAPNWTAGGPPTKLLRLDADAATPMVESRDAASPDLEYLEWDVTSVAHVLRRDHLGRVYVIGGGGGRDVLVALRAGASEVDVAELNPLVVRAVDEDYGAFSGKVYARPGVKLLLGEGRNQLLRSDGSFDLIHMSMVDTWASSVAGSSVLVENGLYTSEAFDLYVSRLSPDGLLSVSRWYDPAVWAEAGRLAVLGADALKRAGAPDPSTQVAILLAPSRLGTGVVTALFRKTPFPPDEIARLEAIALERGFTLLWPTTTPPTEANSDPARWVRLDPQLFDDPVYDLSPPTDDRPFFFNNRRLFTMASLPAGMGPIAQGHRAARSFLQALILVGAIGTLTILMPLRRYAASGPDRSPTAREAVYFGALGVGFMWFELAFVQRFLVYLGHPTYGLSVVLFALLLFTGVGSSLSARIPDRMLSRVGAAAVVAALGVAWALPPLLLATLGATRSVRIALAIVLVGATGTLLGMFMPMGIRGLRAAGREGLVPAVWAVNGFTGVLASVIGMIMATTWGYTLLLVGAGLAYAAAALTTPGPRQSA